MSSIPKPQRACPADHAPFLEVVLREVNAHMLLPEEIEHLSTRTAWARHGAGEGRGRHPVKTVTLVTGTLRSGTSCVTGLLELCGLDLGHAVRILRNPTEYNPRGHFEPDLLVTINERLLTEVQETLCTTPQRTTGEALAALASRREHYFRLFIGKFDGDLCKDPFMSLTLPLWEERWPELQRVVFCLRHPAAVARSMERRYGLPLEAGIEVWSNVVGQFLSAPHRCSLFVFDFDAFTESPAEVLSTLLEWLGRPLEREEVRKRLDAFFDPAFVRSSSGKPVKLTPAVEERYLRIRSLIIQRPDQHGGHADAHSRRPG